MSTKLVSLQRNRWERPQLQQALQPRPEILLHARPRQRHVPLRQLRRLLQLRLVVRRLHVRQPEREVLPQKVQGGPERDLLGNVAQHVDGVLPHQLQAGLQNCQDDDTAQELRSLRSKNSSQIETEVDSETHVTPS